MNHVQLNQIFKLILLVGSNHVQLSEWELKYSIVRISHIMYIYICVYIYIIDNWKQSLSQDIWRFPKSEIPVVTFSFKSLSSGHPSLTTGWCKECQHWPMTKWILQMYPYVLKYYSMFIIYDLYHLKSSCIINYHHLGNSEKKWGTPIH